MIKCSECGKDISNTAPACIGCGAPIHAEGKSIGDINDDGKIGMDDVKEAFAKVTDRVVATAGRAVDQGKELLKSQQKRDQEAVEQMTHEFKTEEKPLQTESEKACGEFSAALESTIDIKFAEIMRGKTNTDRFLTYIDGQVLSATLRNVFKRELGVAPPQIEAACSLSEAILAPTSLEKQELIKKAAGAGGGAAGIAMIIAAVGSALGWGAGVLASVSAFFVGTSVTGPIGWAVAGVAVAGIAAYFATTSNDHSNTERFMKVLKSASSKAVQAVWPEHGEALSKAVKRESAS